MSSQPPSSRPANSTRELPTGLDFEDFSVGDAFLSAGRTLSEADLVGFAGLSGDWNPLHVDENAARRTPFRGRIAHGLLVQALASGLAMQMGIFHGTIAALMEMRIEYRAAVRVGDTIRIRLTVDALEGEPGPKRAWVRFRSEVENQAKDLVIDGHWRVLMLRRGRRPKTRAPKDASTT